MKSDKPIKTNNLILSERILKQERYFCLHFDAWKSNTLRLEGLGHLYSLFCDQSCPWLHVSSRRLCLILWHDLSMHVLSLFKLLIDFIQSIWGLMNDDIQWRLDSLIRWKIRFGKLFTPIHFVYFILLTNFILWIIKLNLCLTFLLRSFSEDWIIFLDVHALFDETLSVEFFSNLDTELEMLGYEVFKSLVPDLLPLFLIEHVVVVFDYLLNWFPELLDHATHMDSFLPDFYLLILEFLLFLKLLFL